MFSIKPKYIRIASFDIGKKNFAFYVEDSLISVLEKLKEEYRSLPNKFQRRVKGPMNPMVNDILEKLFKGSKRITESVSDLRFDEESDNLDIETRKNLIEHLNFNKKLWETCDIFVIEQQYFNVFTGRGKKKSGNGANVDAIKLGEIVMTWFLINFPDKIIVSFGAQFKTQILGAPENLTKLQRKKWATEKAKEILSLRGDSEIEEIFKEYKYRKQKIDDICDCIVECQAYKFRNLIGEF